MLLINIDRSGTVPAYRQVCDRIISLADGGALQPGDRLPSSRALAATVGLHRSSVVRAYGELEALGYIESRSGSYTTIRQRQPTTTKPDGDPPCDEQLLNWESLTDPSLDTLYHHTSKPVTTQTKADKIIDLDRLSADPDLAPDDAIRRSIKHVLIRTHGRALDYAEPQGWKPLREVIARRMRNHGVSVSVDEILITAGAQQAMDLLFRCLLDKGDRVVVEAPTYGMAHALLKVHGIEAVEAPLLHDGMDLDRLEHILADGQQKPKLVFTMPNFHNPTGITTSQQHRERLLSLCEDHQVPLLEDGFEEEMKYFGQAVLPVKSMDRHGLVLYVGTFSKVVFPGLRIGWIAAPRELIQKLSLLLNTTCIAGNTLAQAAATWFCTSGEFEIHLKRVHRIYRQRMQVLQKGLETHMPETVHWTRPKGGYTAWLTLDSVSVSREKLLERIEQAGIRVGPGDRYFATRPDSVHLRLSIACASTQQIEAGCHRLGRVLSEVASV